MHAFCTLVGYGFGKLLVPDRIRYGKLDVNKMHFKFDSHHILIMQTGLELGFRDLSSNQLADCYDEVCNCGETHDPENMKKLRSRVIKIMDRLAQNLPVK
jgi:hypothetical protein